MAIEREKFVDESWKDSAHKHKDLLKKDIKQNTGPSKLHVKAPFNNKEEVSTPANPVTESPSTSRKSDQHEAEDNTAQHEHEQNQKTPQDDEELESPESPEVNFLNYVSSLAFQALIFMGQIPHPSTNEIELNLEQSKLMIDTLVMLREKTKGNLNKQEDNMLNATVYELQMKFVEVNRRAS